MIQLKKYLYLLVLKIFNIIFPYQSLHYYYSYLKNSLQICVFKNKFLKFKYTLAIGFLFYQSMYNIYLAFSYSFSGDKMIVYYNMPQIAFQNNAYNFIWCSFGLIAAMFYYNFYFKINIHVNNFLFDVLFKMKNNLFWYNRKDKKRDIKFIQKIAVIFLNVFQTFILFCRN